MSVLASAVLGLLLLAGAGEASVEFPRPSGFVNDFANIIGSEVEAEIESLCLEIERKTTAEVAVVTVETVKPFTIEEYAVRLFEEWGIGKRGKDNGVLILVAVRDRKVRIEVGYGLEPVLTDGRCGEIIRGILVPAFRRGNFGEGLLEAVRVIGGLIVGEEGAIPRASEGSRSGREVAGGPVGFFTAVWQGFCSLVGLMEAGLLGLLVVGGAALALDLLVSRGPLVHYGPMAVMLPLLIPFGLTFVIAPIAQLVRGRKARALRRKYGRSWGAHMPWWWYGLPPVAGGGGKSWGGGFGGGGFGGFGGGMSGGGGATGSW